MAGLNLGNKAPEEKTPEAGETPETLSLDGKALFSSHPIMNYMLGDYKFENGLLTLSGESEIAAFRECLASQPLSEQTRVRELDVAAAEAQVRAMLALQPTSTRVTDSSVGDRATNSQVGSGTLGE